MSMVFSPNTADDSVTGPIPEVDAERPLELAGSAVP
jgi:hypothetical protein